MTRDAHQRASDLFLKARGLPAADREAFLAAECGPDADLRAAVDRLLRAATAAPEPFAGLAGDLADLRAGLRAGGGGDPRPSHHDPTVDFAAAAAAADIALTDALPMPDALVGLDPLGPGATVGPYTLVEPLGEGGFGTVYLADQDRPVRRRVALKVLKLGMDTRQVVARFEAERQALALMDHPGIAKVFDAGATATGRPYFAMEYVPAPAHRVLRRPPARRPATGSGCSSGSAGPSSTPTRRASSTAT
jgi:hypothetical protein